MDVRNAYNTWADQYDTDENKTRDLEARALREMLADNSFHHCLEIGCGTGKNTECLITKAGAITAVDLSEEMLAKAGAKIKSDKVEFIQADITRNWDFATTSYDLVTFSLVLEHIENLDHIFSQVARVLNKDGMVYIGELHPFKQYTGSKARFETGEGIQIVTCFNHHISDFIKPAKRNGLTLINLEEYFDEDNAGIPRILGLLFTGTSE